MDKIKHAARSNAWYGNFEAGDDGRPRTYNVFGRVRARSKLTKDDEESRLNLQTISTETDAPSPIEAKRRSIASRENAQFAAPGKSYTTPNADSSNRYSSDPDRVDFSSTEKDASKSTSEDTNISATQSRDVHQDEGVIENGVASSGKARKRKFHNLFSKKKDDTQDTIDSEKDEKKKKKVLNPDITIMSQFKAVFLSWINILLVMVPVGIAMGNIDSIPAIAVFVVNFIAIIPLAALLSFSTEELAMYVGEVLGGLLNASFGNAVELIVSIIALAQGEVLIVQTSLIGSMLSNLLLVMGMCFFCGGINRIEQNFNLTVAQTAASLLALAIGSLIIPTAFFIFEEVEGVSPTPLSRATAVMLLVVYACYLIFQLRTHKEVYNAPSEKVAKKSSGKKDAGEALKGIATIGAASGAASAGGGINRENLVQEQPEEAEVPQLTRLGALVTLAISTVFIALCAEYLVSSINEVAQDGVPQYFIGLILLPIVGNAAEHATAVTVAIKDKMDLAIGVAVGSSLQIALLVLPLMILLNWFGLGSPADLDLNFNGWLVVILVLSIWLVNYLINDGKSHWLEGVMLMITYLIIAVGAWFYPTPPGEVVAG